MYDSTVVIAEYPTPGEAHVARARLEAEGIAATVSGDTPNAASWTLFGQMQFTAIQLSVALADAPRARALLASGDEEKLEEGWESAAESAISGWICSSCDTEVPLDQDFCPECGTGRHEVREEGEEPE